MTVHHSKYALSRHTWKESLDNIYAVAEMNSYNLLTPMTGEAIHLEDTTQVFEKWWERG